MVVDDSPRDDDCSHENKADEEDPPTDDEGREEIVEDSQKDGGYPQGLEKPNTQFDTASKNLKLVKAKIVERKLNAGHDQ